MCASRCLRVKHSTIEGEGRRKVVFGSGAENETRKRLIVWSVSMITTTTQKQIDTSVRQETKQIQSLSCVGSTVDQSDAVVVCESGNNEITCV